MAEGLRHKVQGERLMAFVERLKRLLASDSWLAPP